MNADNFKIEKLTKLPSIQYCCGRNAVRVLLEGLGVEAPMLLMFAGIYPQDLSFEKDGKFNVFFNRSVLVNELSNIFHPTVHSIDWEKIYESIHLGYPTIVTVDVYHLPYKKQYMQIHGSHCLIINGYEGDNFIIVDYSEPDYYIGIIDKQILENARTSSNNSSDIYVFSGNPILSEYSQINIPFFENCEYEYDKIIKDNLHKMKLYSDANIKGTSGILFFDKLRTAPNWLENGAETVYINFLQSLFMLQVELAFFEEYLNEISKNQKLIQFDTGNILHKCSILKLNVEKFKNTFLLSHRRKKSYSLDNWDFYTGAIYESISAIYESI